jgi:hypothetical protein
MLLLASDWWLIFFPLLTLKSSIKNRLISCEEENGKMRIYIINFMISTQYNDTHRRLQKKQETRDPVINNLSNCHGHQQQCISETIIMSQWEREALINWITTSTTAHMVSTENKGNLVFFSAHLKYLNEWAGMNELHSTVTTRFSRIVERRKKECFFIESCC